MPRGKRLDCQPPAALFLLMVRAAASRVTDARLLRCCLTCHGCSTSSSPCEVLMRRQVLAGEAGGRRHTSLACPGDGALMACGPQSYAPVSRDIAAVDGTYLFGLGAAGYPRAERGRGCDGGGAERPGNLPLDCRDVRHTSRGHTGPHKHTHTHTHTHTFPDVAIHSCTRACVSLV